MKWKTIPRHTVFLSKSKKSQKAKKPKSFLKIKNLLTAVYCQEIKSSLIKRKLNPKVKMNRILQFRIHLPQRLPQNLTIIQSRNMAKAKGGKAGKVKKVRNNLDTYFCFDEIF